MYRTDQDRSPFYVPNDAGRNRDTWNTQRKDQWWHQERLPRPRQESSAPRARERNDERDYPVRKNRPWGEIPQWEDFNQWEKRERVPYYGDDPVYDNEPPPSRYERRLPRETREYPLEQERIPSRRNRSYWDGPYQREENNRDRYYYDRYDRELDYREPVYRDPYSYSDTDSWRRGSRYRNESWDPWERDRYLTPRER